MTSLFEMDPIISAEQIDVAHSILIQLEEAIRDKGREDLPPIHVVELASIAAILIEWIFPTCRLIFNIEQDCSESGWGFVSTSGELISGSLDSADYGFLVHKLLEDAS